MYKVYQIINAATKKRYIGMTSMSLAARMSAHRNYGRRKASKSYLHASMKKHGDDAFSIHLIHECETRELAAELERFLIEECDSLYPNGYNLRTGGDGGYQWHETSKAKARKNTKEYFAKNPDAKAKVSAEQSARWQDPAMRVKYLAAIDMPRDKCMLRKAQLLGAAAKRAKRETALREGTATRYQIAQALIDSRKDMTPAERKYWHTKRMIAGGVGRHKRSPETLQKQSTHMHKLWLEKGKAYFGHQVSA